MLPGQIRLFKSRQYSGRTLESSISSSHSCFPDLQGARYQSHHLCGIMYGRQVRHDRKILMIKARARHSQHQCSRCPAMAHSKGHGSLYGALSPHFCCTRTLIGVVGAKSVWMCAYAYVRIYFITFLCTMAATGPSSCLFQQNSETAETRREACLTPYSVHWGFPLPVWSGFNLSSSVICFSISFLALVCLAFFFLPADLEMTFYLLLISYYHDTRIFQY